MEIDWHTTEPVLALKNFAHAAREAEKYGLGDNSIIFIDLFRTFGDTYALVLRIRVFANGSHHVYDVHLFSYGPDITPIRPLPGYLVSPQ